MRALSLFLAVLLAAAPAYAMSRIKDIATIQSVRDNQLVGYGLVIGLQGSGDGLRNSPFTEQSVRSMLDAFGVATESGSARLKNVAAVIVTATMPPFVNAGSRIDINVGSLGDATSLRGGTLIMTPLRGPDGVVYAVGQGPISVTGFTAEGDAASLTAGVPTSGRIPGGAIVEREVPGPAQGCSDIDAYAAQSRFFNGDHGDRCRQQVCQEKIREKHRAGTGRPYGADRQAKEHLASALHRGN